MDVRAAKRNPQKFIDFLSINPYIDWHFKNDCKWPYIKTPGEEGWCGDVQLIFYYTLFRQFNEIGRICKRFNFTLQSGISHCVTSYEGLIIDTFFNVLIYKGEWIPLTTSPTIERHYAWKDVYSTPQIKWDFQHLSLSQTNVFEQYFPSFLRKGEKENGC